MLGLQPLLVVTGTIHVEGGEKSEARNTTVRKTPGSDQVMTVYSREVTDDRRRANGIIISFTRRLRVELRLLKPPYGTLVLPSKKAALLQFMQDATRACAKFNLEAKGCSLANCMVWEELTGNRLVAVEGWLVRRAQTDKAVAKVLALLKQPLP